MIKVNMTSNPRIKGIAPKALWSVYNNLIKPGLYGQVQIIFYIESYKDLTQNEYNYKQCMWMSTDAHVKAMRIQTIDKKICATFRPRKRGNNYAFKNWLDYSVAEYNTDWRNFYQRREYDLEYLKQLDAFNYITDKINAIPDDEDIIKFVNDFAGPYEVTIHSTFETNKPRSTRVSCAGTAKRNRYNYCTTSYQPNCIQEDKFAPISMTAYRQAYLTIKTYQAYGIEPDESMWIKCPVCGHFHKRTQDNDGATYCYHCGYEFPKAECPITMRDFLYEAQDLYDSDLNDMDNYNDLYNSDAWDRDYEDPDPIILDNIDDDDPMYGFDDDDASLDTLGCKDFKDLK